METAHIEKLSLEYEKAFNDLDIKTSAEFFAESFISAGPNGSVAQSKREFLQKAEQASAFYKSVGQNSARILSKNIFPISDQYTMVTVHWGVTFERTNDQLIEFDVSYIVFQGEDKPSIILFIARQDEQEAMHKLGLLDQLNPA